jgi:arginase
MELQVVAVPYRYDEPRDGLGRGPDALIEAGLVRRLRAAGMTVGDPVESHLPDDERVSAPVAINIGRLGAHTAEKIADARGGNNPVLVLAGDDTSAVGVISGLQRAHGVGAAIGLIWLDAHGDFNTPETTYSGILAGMPVAILAGLAGPLWRDAAGLQAPLSTDRILLAGVRELDEKEDTLIRSTDVRVLMADEVREGNDFADAVGRLASQTDLLALHVDLDLLDPSLVPSASTPSRHGLSIAQAAHMIRLVVETGKTAVVTVAGLNPGAGARGELSIASTLSLLETSLPAWIAATDAPNAGS